MFITWTTQCCYPFFMISTTWPTLGTGITMQI